MSRLHTPGPGDLLDRLTILALKLTYGREAGRDLTRWRQEFDALEAQLGQKVDAYLMLAAINAALWQAEDEMRRYRSWGSRSQSWIKEVAVCGVRIQSLNDHRCALVAQLNGEPGMETKL